MFHSLTSQRNDHHHPFPVIEQLLGNKKSLVNLNTLLYLECHLDFHDSFCRIHLRMPGNTNTVLTIILPMRSVCLLGASDSVCTHLVMCIVKPLCLALSVSEKPLLWVDWWRLRTCFEPVFWIFETEFLHVALEPVLVYGPQDYPSSQGSC